MWDNIYIWYYLSKQDKVQMLYLIFDMGILIWKLLIIQYWTFVLLASGYKQIDY